MTLAIQALRLSPAYELIFQELEQRILAGVLKPGDRLPVESDLAASFGVNRSTLREGIRLLEREGLLRRVNGKRLEVSLPRYQDLAPRAIRALVMRRVTFIELWEVAIVSEPLTAQLAAEHATAGDIAALDDNLRRSQAALAAGLSPAEIDTEFHSLITRAARNRVLELAREPIGLLLYPAFERLIPLLAQAGARMQEAHGHVVDAIRARRPDVAAEWMRKHLKDFRRGYEMAGLPLDMVIDAPAALAERRGGA